MITKEKYVDFMERIESTHKVWDYVDNAVSEISNNVRFGYLNSEYEDLLIEMIELAANDTEQWTSYFFFEYNCNIDSAHVYRRDGTRVEVHNWADVYDLIIGVKDV